MITKMKKLNLLVYHKDYDDFLSQLQNLGVVHIQELENGTTSEEFEQAKARYEEYAEVLNSLDKIDDSGLKAEKALPFESAAQIVAFTKQQFETESELKRKLDAVNKDLEIAEPWGEFDAEKVKKLAELGYQMNFYSCYTSKFDKEWENTYFAIPINQTSSSINFVTFSPEKPVIDAENIELPKYSISELRAQKADLEEQLDEVKQNIIAVKQNQYSLLVSAQAENRNAIQLSKVHLNSVDLADDTLKLVEGWIPEDKETDVKAMLDASGAYYEVRSPQKGDNVPIKFKNNKFSSMYERLTKMYGFPDYDEWDPTPIVAIFFTLFFAICMGDAGYGILITLYGILDMKGKAKKVPILGEMLEGCGPMICSLGIATTVIGFFLGTFFGINIVEAGWIPETTVLGKVLAWLQGNVPGTTYSIQMAAAICIGVFHICLAMVIKAIVYTKKEGFKSQISTWGWCLLIIGGVIVGVLALTGTFNQQTTIIVLIAIGAISALAIYFLNNIDRLVSKPIAGLIVNPLAGLYDTYNKASGLMGDVLSYIRLYALCLAGGMLGGAFNMIGDMVRGDEGSILLLIPALLIYVIGHLFNLLMSAISAFVHPLRLNFVEYFKNSGYDGKGQAYNPFEVKK